MQLFRKRQREPRPPYGGAIVSLPVAFVENGIARPRPHGWETVRSTLAFAPEHAARLAGLAAFSHAIVVTYLDLAADAPEKPETLALRTGSYGIFATRSQLRPNHLGVTVVELLAVEGLTVRVRGLDAIDGTAVLDIKPYLPEYDAVPGARIPRRVEGRGRRAE